MSELTVEELEAKIKQVQNDIANGLVEKGREALGVYLEYLKDELKMKKNEKAS
jgi:hypothetical protein